MEVNCQGLACHQRHRRRWGFGGNGSEQTEVIYQMENLPKGILLSASHQTDFTPPIYNIWKQQDKTPRSESLW